MEPLAKACASSSRPSQTPTTPALLGLLLVFLLLPPTCCSAATTVTPRRHLLANTAAHHSAAASVLGTTHAHAAAPLGISAAGGGVAVASSATAASSLDVLNTHSRRQQQVRRLQQQQQQQQQQLSEGWRLNATCDALQQQQTCSSLNGTCFRTYNSSAGCGANMQVSVTEYTINNSTLCRWTGCSWGGCNSSEAEVASSWCGYAYDERCCRKLYTYTCRSYHTCTWVQPKNLGVFLPAGGAWVGNATTDLKTNSYIAAILANYMYEDSLGVVGISAFTTAFASRVAWRMNATRLSVYYGPRDTEWLLLDTPKSFIVVFRGTEGIFSSDMFITNLQSLTKTSTTDFGGTDVSIASGFYSAFDANKLNFTRMLGAFKNASSSSPNKPLWLTGHSLGGALATLFGAYAHLKGHPVQGVITFGSPIVGNAGWRAAYPLNSRTYRYEVPGDPVPSLPPWPAFDYADHVGALASVPPCAASASAAASSSSSSGRRRSLSTTTASADAAEETTTATTTMAEDGAAAAAAAKASAAAASDASDNRRAGSAGAADGLDGSSSSSSSSKRAAARASSRKAGSSRKSMCGVWELTNPQAAAAAGAAEEDQQQQPKQGQQQAVRAKANASGKKNGQTEQQQQETYECPPTPVTGSSGANESTPAPTGSAGGSGGGGGGGRKGNAGGGGRGGAPVTRGSISVAAHGILPSYTANIYYCAATSAEAATLPTYASIVAL